jgi:hypothetical protein
MVCSYSFYINIAVNVGVIFLQQFAQLKQSISFHTAVSTVSTIVLMFLGGFFSTFLKKRL